MKAYNIQMKGAHMKMSTPTIVTFVVSAALAIAGLLGQLNVLDLPGFWLLFAGFVLLFLGNLGITLRLSSKKPNE